MKAYPKQPRLPANVQARIPVNQKQGFRDVAVKVVITGQLASGYQVTNIKVTPPIVTLSSSDPALMQRLAGSGWSHCPSESCWGVY